MTVTGAELRYRTAGLFVAADLWRGLRRERVAHQQMASLRAVPRRLSGTVHVSDLKPAKG